MIFKMKYPWLKSLFHLYLQQWSNIENQQRMLCSVPICSVVQFYSSPSSVLHLMLHQFVFDLVAAYRWLLWTIQSHLSLVHDRNPICIGEISELFKAKKSDVIASFSSPVTQLWEIDPHSVYIESSHRDRCVLKCGCMQSRVLVWLDLEWIYSDWALPNDSLAQDHN